MRDNYAAEIKALTQHLGTHKESMAFARLADRYLQLNEVEKALDICQNGLRNHPHYDSAHFVLAKCFLALNQLEEAEKHLKHLLSRNPQFLNAHRLYASLMARMGMTSRERTSLLQLRELDPFFAGIAAEAGLEAPAAEVATPPETWPVPPAPKPESWPAPPASAPAPAAAAPSGGLSPTPPPAPQEPFATAPAAMAPAAAPAVVPPAAAAPAAEPSPWDRAPVPPPPAFSPSTPPQPFAPESKFAEPEPQPRPVSEYRPPVPEMDLDAFARELAALEVPASEEASETPAGPVGEIQPLAEAAIEIREPENDFEREETQFSEILDDLFSLSRDEEDRREQEARHTIERAARQPEPDLGPPAPAAEVVRPGFDFEPPAPPPAPPTPPEPAASVLRPGFDFEPPAPPAPAAPPAPTMPAAEEGMSPVLPFRGDEEWQEDARFAEAPEPEEPVRLQPPTVESEPFEEEEELQEPRSSATGMSPLDNLGETFLDAEEEEEQFTDFLANLDRLGGAALEGDEEEDLSPEPRKPFAAPWDDEPEERTAPAELPPPPEQPRPRIAPLAEAEEPGEAPAASDKPKDKFVTPTLGEIYAAQGQYAKAINVFEMLLKKNPENEWYRTKLEYLRKRLEDEKI